MKTARNLQVVSEARAGCRACEIAWRHGISRTRVYQILADHRARQLNPYEPLSGALLSAVRASVGELPDDPGELARIIDGTDDRVLRARGIGAARRRKVLAFVDRHLGRRRRH
jgi:hypothetical protein